MRSICPLVAVVALVASSPSPVQAANWAEKMFDSLEHDFGVVARGADVRHRFKITNIYKETVHIASVTTTCGCSAATPTKRTLASRETAEIEVVMDTRRFIRRKDSNLIVTFDAPFYAEVRIPITAYIRTDVVLEPGSVDFGTVDVGASAQRTVVVKYAGRPDWKIREVRTGSEQLEAAVQEVRREDGRVDYELHVTLHAENKPGTLRRQITLVTDDEGSPYIPVLVHAQIAADITVTPEVVSLGLLKPGETKSFNVVLKGRRPFLITGVESATDKGMAFQVRLPKSARPVHVLPLTVTAPSSPGTLSEEFSVNIEGRAEPVTFRVFAQVVDSDAGA